MSERNTPMLCRQWGAFELAILRDQWSLVDNITPNTKGGNVMKTIKDFETRHFNALKAIGKDVTVIVQDDMPETMFNLLQIDAACPNTYLDIIEYKPDTIVVKRTHSGERAVRHFDIGFHQAKTGAVATPVDDVPYMPFPIDHMFGLTYAAYFVMPRLAARSMSQQWQQRFVDLMNEMEAEGIHPPDDYTVTRDGMPVDPWSDYRHGDAKVFMAADDARRNKGDRHG